MGISNYPSSGPPPPPVAGGGYSSYAPSPFAAQAVGYSYQYSVPQYAGSMAPMSIPSAVYNVQKSYEPYGYPSAPAPNIAPAPVQLPYSAQLNQINYDMYLQQARAMEDLQRQLAQSVINEPSQKHRTGSRQGSASSQKARNTSGVDEEAMKRQIKELFIDELMRRQEFNGTFDFTEGTVKEMRTYTATDPIVPFYQQTRQEDLTGKAWNPEADCEYLRAAMKGLGTNEEAIINVVTTRNNAQRQKLKQMFKTMYGRDLISDIESELSGNFRESVMALFVPPAEYDAWSVKQAIYGLGTDEQTLIEIFLTRTNEQLRQIKAAYPAVVSPKKNIAAKVLEDDIVGDTSGDFKRLLVSASQANRYEIDRPRLSQAVVERQVNGKSTGIFEVDYQKLVDLEKAKKDALRLYKAGEDRWGTDEEEFNIIFSTRDYYHLRETWNEYVKISQRDILNSIDRETSGDYKQGLYAIVRNIRCRPMYFANRLRDAIKGLGTDDKTLIRIIVSRSEIDLVQIKKCFLELTQQTLWRWIKDDTSGDYRRLLLAIVGKD